MSKISQPGFGAWFWLQGLRRESKYPQRAPRLPQRAQVNGDGEYRYLLAGALPALAEPLLGLCGRPRHAGALGLAALRQLLAALLAVRAHTTEINKVAGVRGRAWGRE